VRKTLFESQLKLTCKGISGACGGIIQSLTCPVTDLTIYNVCYISYKNHMDRPFFKREEDFL
jgi:hypothetical protein